MTKNITVVVIGGGYAGVLAANRLTQRDDTSVTLINARPHFVERIRLHQLIAGSHDTTPATATVTVVGAGPTGIETAAELAEAGRTVTLICGHILGRTCTHEAGARSPNGSPHSA